MPWITLKYRPGFSADLTSWDTCIEPDGTLSQTARIRRVSPHMERTDHLSAELSSGQLSDLRELIAAMDFGAIAAAARGFSMCDAERCSVTVHLGDEVSFFVDVPLMSWSHLQQEGVVPQFDLSSALRLWHFLDAISPYGLHSKFAEPGGAVNDLPASPPDRH